MSDNRTAEREKRIALDFFYWWHNQPGSNTEEGFSAYKKTERYKMLDVSITVEADARDEYASQQTASLREENERLQTDLRVTENVRDSYKKRLEQLQEEVERLTSALKGIEPFAMEVVSRQTHESVFGYNSQTLTLSSLKMIIEALSSKESKPS